MNDVFYNVDYTYLLLPRIDLDLNYLLLLLYVVYVVSAFALHLIQGRAARRVA